MLMVGCNYCGQLPCTLLTYMMWYTTQLEMDYKMNYYGTNFELNKLSSHSQPFPLSSLQACAKCKGYTDSYTFLKHIDVSLDRLSGDT